MAKATLRLKVREFRRQGKSINEITKLLDARKHSVSLWCRDIELTEEQKQKLWKRSKTRFYRNFKAYCERKRQKTKTKIKKLKDRGVNRVGNLNKREFFIGGAFLYWAEGFKSGHQVGFVNSDPDMIKFFINWITRCCGVKKDRLKARIGINISHKHRVDEVENYWSQITDIPRSQFNKPSYKKTKWQKQFEKPEDYYGVLQIRVLKSTDLLREILGYIAGLRNQGRVAQW